MISYLLLLKQIPVPKLDLSALTGDSSSQPSDESSARLTVSTQDSKPEGKDGGTTDPSLPNGSSATIPMEEGNKESSPPSEDILKVSTLN